MPGERRYLVWGLLWAVCLTAWLTLCLTPSAAFCATSSDNPAPSISAPDLAEITDPELRGLVQDLYSGNVNKARAAAKQIGAMGPKASQAVPSLILFSTDYHNDLYTRASAIEALARIGDPLQPIIIALFKTLGDPQTAIHHLSAESLCRLHTRSSSVLEIAIKHLLDENTNYPLGSTANLLACIGSDASSAIPALTKAMGYTRDSSRMLIARSLILLAFPELQTPAGLRQGLHSVDPLTGLIAVSGLLYHAPKMRKLFAHENNLSWVQPFINRFPPDQFASFLPDVLHLLKDPSRIIRDAAIFTLSEFQPPSKLVIESIFDALRVFKHNTSMLSTIERLGTQLPLNQQIDIFHTLTSGYHDEHWVNRYPGITTISVFSDSISAKRNDLSEKQILHMLQDLLRFTPSKSMNWKQHQEYNRISNATQSLQAELALRQRNETRDFIKGVLEEADWTAIAVVVLFAVFLFAHIFFHIPWDRRRRWTVSLFEFTHRHPSLTKWPVLLRIGFRLEHYASRPRTLDAWIQPRRQAAWDKANQCSCFAEMRKGFYHAMPVELTDCASDEQRPFDKPSPDDFKALMARDTLRLAISGQGGAGKTSLAYRLLSWCCDPTEHGSIAARPLLPWVLEDDLADSELRPDDLLATQIAQHKAFKITPVFARLLLDAGRILPVVDHFSEMNQKSREALSAALKGVPRWIVTTRLDSDCKTSATHRLQPKLMGPNEIKSFLEAFIELKDLEDYKQFGQDQSHLADMIIDSTTGAGPERGVTPLIVTLFAEQMEERYQNPDEAQRELPKDVPSLILESLNRSNKEPDLTKGELSDREVQRLMKGIAYACLEAEFKPARRAQDEVRAVFPDEADWDNKIHYLCENLGILKVYKDLFVSLRVSQDPVAEYLAAFFVIEAYGADEEKWADFCEAARSKPGELEEIRGFMHAVYTTSQIDAFKKQVPAKVVEELAGLAGLSWEEIKQKRLNDRVDSYSILLANGTVPDKLHAITTLKRILKNYSSNDHISSSIKHILIHSLADSSTRVVAKSAIALSELKRKDEHMIIELIKVVSDYKDDIAATAAILSLGSLGKYAETALGELYKYTNLNPGNPLRETAYYAIKQIENDLKDNTLMSYWPSSLLPQHDDDEARQAGEARAQDSALGGGEDASD